MSTLNERTNLPQVQRDGLVMLVLCIVAVLDWGLCIFLCVSPFPALQQRHHHLSSFAHFKPKLGVAAVAAAVSATASRVPFYPATSQLMTVCQQVSCRSREASG